jgi:CRP-like cAMP-binding protein
MAQNSPSQLSIGNKDSIGKINLMPSGDPEGCIGENLDSVVEMPTPDSSMSKRRAKVDISTNLNVAFSLQDLPGTEAPREPKTVALRPKSRTQTQLGGLLGDFVTRITANSLDKPTGEDNSQSATLRSLWKIGSHKNQSSDDRLYNACLVPSEDRLYQHTTVILRFLENVHPLKNIDQLKLDNLCLHLGVAKYKAGQIICRKGHRSKSVFFLAYGKIGVTAPKSNISLDKILKNYTDPGYYKGYKLTFDMFGDWECLYNRNRSVDYVCLEETMILTLKEEIYKSVIGDIFKKMLRDVIKSLKDISYFNGWYEPSVGDFLDNLKLYKYEHGQVIYDAGSTDQYLYIINRGAVQISYKYNTATG